MLHHGRIRLRDVEHKDDALLAGWWNDREVMRWLPAITCRSLATQEKITKGYIEANGPDQDTVMYVVEVEEAPSKWKGVGWVSAWDMNRRAGTCEVGIVIGEKSMQNQGLGTEALETLLTHLFTNYRMHRIELNVFEGNARARRCYERLGFVQEGTKRDAAFKNGVFHNVVVMSVLVSEFKPVELR